MVEIYGDRTARAAIQNGSGLADEFGDLATVV
jgi:hypothetical protein